VNDPQRVEDLLRECAPQVLGALVRRYRQFDLCEDATQEALLAAATTWPTRGIPTNPWKWLVTVGSRRVIDSMRADASRRSREELVAHGGPAAEMLAPEPGDDGPQSDDSLTLLVLCCHPALTQPSQIALTLRAVGGLTTSEIATAFLVPESTMAQRIARAKQTIRTAGAVFELPEPEALAVRLVAVAHVLYLVFTEGHTATSGGDVNRVDLTDEAIRLTRELRHLCPEDSEVAGLLALMLLVDARRAARTTSSGELIPLDRQDRTLWNAGMIAEGTQLVTEALGSGSVGPYQLQAAINAVHNAAASTRATDWTEIVDLYELLEQVSANPMIRINRAIAVGMAKGPDAGLALLDAVPIDDPIHRHHRAIAVRGHLLELAGRRDEAADAFRQAARLATNLPEKRHLQKRAGSTRSRRFLHPTGADPYA